jgi:hypothetical protein
VDQVAVQHGILDLLQGEQLHLLDKGMQVVLVLQGEAVLTLEVEVEVPEALVLQQPQVLPLPMQVMEVMDQLLLTLMDLQ